MTALPMLPTAAATTAEADVERQVRAHLVAQFYSTVKQQFLAVFLIMPMWGFLFYAEFKRPAILWWVGITMGMQVLRLILNLRYQKLS